MNTTYRAPSFGEKILVGIFFLPVALISLGLVIAMNKALPESMKYETGPKIEFNVIKPKPKKQKKAKEVKPKRAKRTAPRQLVPPPSLDGNFSGVSFGMDGFDFGDQMVVTDDMIGNMDGLLMTEDSVDSVPTIKYQPSSPQFPPRAAKENLKDLVHLWLIVGEDGLPKDIEVTESDHPEYFDEAAIAYMRQFRFQPAMYQGRPREMPITYKVDFGKGGQ